MKCKFIRPEEEVATDSFGRIVIIPRPAGWIHERHDAYLLVRCGIAEPADEECRIAAGLSPDQIKDASTAQGRIRRGIQPEDYQAFDDGLMIGYYPDGSWIPGPNAVSTTDQEDLPTYE